jgi:glutathione S-transferase
MSLRFITIDHLMQLDKPTLEYALRTFQKELDGTLALLRETPEAAADELTLADLTHVLTLRKVFRLRLEELAQEAQLTALTHSQPLASAA